MLKGVVFDMDGVLLDSHPAHHEAWRMFLREFGREISDDDLRFVTDGRKREDILRRFFGELSDEQLLKYGALKDKHFSAAAHKVKTLSGATDLVKQLFEARIPTAVATSASGTRAAAMLDQFGFSTMLNAVVTGNDVSRGKPDPAIFLLAASRLGLDPETVVVFEDAVSGVKAAKAAGMACVGIADEGRRAMLQSAGADVVCKDMLGLSVADLEAVIARSSNRIRAKVATPAC